MNRVERWSGLLIDKLTRRSVHTCVQVLENDIEAGIATWNTDPGRSPRPKPVDEVLNSLAVYLAKLRTEHPVDRQE